MPGKPKKSALDVDYLRTATSSSLAASIFVTKVKEEEQQLLHEKQAQQIAIEVLFDNPYQPRAAMDEQSLQQLTETIASHGFQGVLVARPHPQRPGTYQITAGHRRREAARKAGFKTLPVIVHSWSDRDMATLSATENIQREDLSPLEEGKLFQLMMDTMGLTQIEVANAVKKDRGYVRNRLRLAKAPEDIQTFISHKADSMRAVIYLLDIEDPAERAPIIEQLLKRTLTTEDLPAYIGEIKQRGHAPSQYPDHSPVSAQQPQPLSAPASIEPPLQTADRLETTEQTPPVPTLAPVVQKRAQPTTPLRVRNTKLKTILRYITEFQKSLAQQEALNEEERELIQQIIAIAQALVSI